MGILFSRFEKRNFERAQRRKKMVSLLSDHKGVGSRGIEKKDKPAIVIYMYTHHQDGSLHHIIVDDAEKEYVVEDLCKMAAKKYNIGSVAFHIFALVTPDLQTWLPQNKKLHCPESGLDEYFFRIRLNLSKGSIDKLALCDTYALEYHYLQMCDDFIFNIMKSFYNCSISGKHAIPLAVITIYCLARQQNLDYEDAKNKFKLQDFLPATYLKDFNFILLDKLKLNKHYKDLLKKEYKENMDVENISYIHRRYILGLKEKAEEEKAGEKYQREEFRTEKGDIVYIGTDEEGHRLYRTPRGGKVRLICDIREISSVKLSPFYNEEDKNDGSTLGNGQTNNLESPLDRRKTIGWAAMVLLKDSPPEIISVLSEGQAWSLASLIDSYYRMLEDFYFSPCSDVEPPMINYLREHKCHGPINKSFVKDWLKDRGHKQGLYVLRQRSDRLDEYVLAVAKNSQQTKYRVSLEETGRYRLQIDGEPDFPALWDLIAYYQDGSKWLKLKTPIFNSHCRGQAYQQGLLLCRKTLSEEGASGQTERAPAIVCIQASDLEGTADQEKLLVKGQFTEVHPCYWERYDDEMEETIYAVKKLKVECEDDYLKYFQRGIYRASFWNQPSSIIKIHAWCLSPRCQVVMEHAPFGPLDKYLQAPGVNLKVFHLLQAAQNLANALCYLETQADQAHGNIRCRNVLVTYRTASSLQVKLADPGLVHLANSLPLTHAINRERLAWVAPECYGELGKDTCSSDLFAYGTTLWEIFSQGHDPFPKDFNAQQIMAFWRSGELLPMPRDLPKSEGKVYDIMKECWSLDPERRCQPKQIIRDLISLLQATNSYDTPQWQHDELFKDSGTFTSDADNDLLRDIGSVSTTHTIVPPSDNIVKEQMAALPDTCWTGVAGARKDQSLTLTEISSGSSLMSPLSPGRIGGSGESQVPLLGSFASDQVNLGFQAHHRDNVTHPRTPLSLPQAGPPSTAKATAGGHSERPLPELPHQIKLEYLLQRDWITLNTKRKLGEGYFGEVYEGVLNRDKSVRCAIKTLKSEFLDNHDQLEDEVKIMIELQHPHIIKILGICYQSSEKPCLLVMELVENGSLKNYLKKNRETLSVEQMMKWSSQVAQGMEFLSNKNMVHRDLAARNVLVNKDLMVKVSDFGLTRVLAPDNVYYKIKEQSQKPVFWWPPEAISGVMRFTPKGDVWSYGILLWEMFSFGEFPKLCSTSKIASQLEKGIRLPRPKICPEDVYTLIMKACWRKSAAERPAFSEILDQLARINISS